MFDKGRHDRHTQQHQESRVRLRKGIAKVALKEQVTGQPTADAYGRPMRWAKEMARSHSIGNVERFAKGWGEAFLRPTKRWCAGCKRLGVDPWKPLEHSCAARA